VSTQALWFETALLPEGWSERVHIGIRDGRIATINSEVAPGGEMERHSVALPGIPNVHSHAFQRAMAGLAETRASGGPAAGRDDFWSWRELMYRFVDRLTPDDLESIAQLAYLEMLEAGFTRVGEFHYLHHAPNGSHYDNPAEMCERVVAAASVTGIGLTLLPVLYCHSGFGGASALQQQRRFVTDVSQFARLLDAARRVATSLPDAIVGVAPHSLRAVTPDRLIHAVQLAGEQPVHIHVAEQVAEVDACVNWLGERPVQWLLNHMRVDSRWCLVHATHLDDEEVRRLAESGAAAGLCPITEANLGDGMFRANDYLAANGSLGIGSDSNVLISASEELRQLEYAQRLTRRARNVLASDVTRSTGRRLVDSVVLGGHRALGVQAAGLTVGAAADIVSLDATHPSLPFRQRDTLLDSWIFACSGSAVDNVWRAGRKVVVRGRHVLRDSVVTRYRNTLKRLLA